MAWARTGVEVQPILVQVHYDFVPSFEARLPTILREYDDPATLADFCVAFYHASPKVDLTANRICDGFGARRLARHLRGGCRYR